MKNKIIPLEIKKEIINDYVTKNICANKLAKIYNITRPGVVRILKKYNVYKKTGTRKHTHDENFFQNIDTEEKAYWLGFIAADGNVVGRGRQCLSITLSDVDKNHLEKFKLHINATNPINNITQFNKKYNKNIYMADIRLYSLKTINFLNKHGIVPNKTKILKWEEMTKNIPYKLIKHFIRGYFDGDGAWTITQNKLMFSIVSGSNFDILTPIMDYICESTGLSKVKLYIRKDNIKYFIKGGNKQGVALYNFLYNDASIYLERKKQKAFNFIQNRLT